MPIERLTGQINTESITEHGCKSGHIILPSQVAGGRQVAWGLQAFGRTISTSFGQHAADDIRSDH